MTLNQFYDKFMPKALELEQTTTPTRSNGKGKWYGFEFRFSSQKEQIEKKLRELIPKDISIIGDEPDYIQDSPGRAAISTIARKIWFQSKL